jgi:WD40 repeat protein
MEPDTTIVLRDRRYQRATMGICALLSLIIAIMPSIAAHGAQDIAAANNLPANLPPIGHVQGCGGVAVTFSADGKYLLTTGKHCCRVWTVSSFVARTPVIQYEGDVHSAAISNDGSIVMTFGPAAPETKRTLYGKACIWDGRSGGLLFSVALHGSKKVWSASLSGDGSLLATSADGDEKICLWDVARKSISKEIKCLAPVEKVLLSPDGKRLLTVSSQQEKSQIWDTQTGHAVGDTLDVSHNATVFAIPRDRTRFAAFSRDGRCLVVASGDAFRTFETLTGRLIADNGGAGRATISWVDINSDGSVVAEVEDLDGSSQWNGHDGTRIGERRIVGGDLDVISPNGRLVLLDGAPGEGGLFSVANGQRIQQFKLDKEPLFVFEDACFSPDGSKVAITYFEDTFVWPVAETHKKPKGPGSVPARELKATSDRLESSQQKDPPDRRTE